MSESKINYTCKIVLVGDSYVGKSQLLNTLTNNDFNANIKCTIGVDFKVKFANIGNKSLKAVLWDTAGQERFRTLTSSYFREAHAIWIIYDVTSMESVDNLRNWIKEVNEFANSYPTVYLIGNKYDVNYETDNLVVDKANKIAKDNNYRHIIASSKEFEQVNNIFMSICKELLDDGKVKLVEGKEKTALFTESKIKALESKANENERQIEKFKTQAESDKKRIEELERTIQTLNTSGC